MTDQPEKENAPTVSGEGEKDTTLAVLNTPKGLSNVDNCQGEIPPKCCKTEETVREIRRLLGKPVLLPIPRGQKGPAFHGWNTLTYEETMGKDLVVGGKPLPSGAKTKGELYHRVILTGNIGVLLGTASDGLVAIDIDDDITMDWWFNLPGNECFKESLRTFGSRGCTCWIKVRQWGAEGIPSCNMVSADGARKIEVRADGRQSVIYGTHPVTGKKYQRLVDAPPVEVESLEDIQFGDLNREAVAKREYSLVDHSADTDHLKRQRELVHIYLKTKLKISEQDIEDAYSNIIIAPCPGEKEHGNKNRHGDTWYFVGGQPTVKCLHESCKATVAATQEELRVFVRKESRIIIPSGGIPTTNDVARELVARLKRHEHFCRVKRGDGFKLAKLALRYGATPITNDSGAVCGGLDSHVASVDLRVISPTAAVSCFEEMAEWGRYKKKKTKSDGESTESDCDDIEGEVFRGDEEGVTWAPGVLTPNVCAAVLEADPVTQGLPEFKAVKLIPILMHDPKRKSGVTLIRRGWTPDGVYVAPNNMHLPAMTVEEAVGVLDEMFEEYSFRNAADKRIIQMAFLLPALQTGKFLNGRSVAVFIRAIAGEGEPSGSQSGKSSIGEAFCALYRDKAGMISEDEERGVDNMIDRLSRLLAQGSNIFVLDNLTKDLKKATLESFLTRNFAYNHRVAYSQGGEFDPSASVLMLNSNGLELSTDMANRCIIAELEKKPNQFRRGSLLYKWVEDNHARVLSAVYSLIANWASQGCPVDDVPHDNRECAGKLAAIARLAGIPNLLGDQEEKRRTHTDSTIEWGIELAKLMANEEEPQKEYTALEIVRLCCGENRSGAVLPPPWLDARGQEDFLLAMEAPPDIRASREVSASAKLARKMKELNADKKLGNLIPVERIAHGKNPATYKIHEK